MDKCLRLASVCGTALVIIISASGFLLLRATGAESYALSQADKARDTVTLHAAGQGIPWMNVRDGYDLPTAYVGEAGLEQALTRGLAQPLALVSGDFDEDGVPDLVSGYVGPGGGLLTLHRGNMDLIWPNSPEARKRMGEGANGRMGDEATGSPSPILPFSHSPFLPQAKVFELPGVPDFLGVGDFDADGHWDVVIAARDSDTLYWLPGDGQGRIGSAKQIKLPGTVTALVTGEINRADGVTDVVVGVVGPEGPQVLVFESPEGALWNAEGGMMNDERANAIHHSSFGIHPSPEVFALPTEATALALGQLDESYEMDLAVAAGNELWIVHGRDRRLSLDEIRRAEVPPVMIEGRAFAFEITSIALGDFVSDQAQQADIALLADDGAIHVLASLNRSAANAGAHGGAPLQARAAAHSFVRASVSGRPLSLWPSDVLARGAGSPATHLLCARISGLPTDDLIVIDSGNHQLHILMSADETFVVPPSGGRSWIDETFVVPPSGGRLWSQALPPEGGTTNNKPVAVLPMRLNADALSDLVILREGTSAPAVALTEPLAIFTVTSANDSGPGSLRQAIQQANNRPGADMIVFRIGSGAQTITLRSPLPPITGPVTIDGTSQPGFAGSPIIELNGSNAGTDANGLRIMAGSSVVRGLVINRFSMDGVRIDTNGSAVVEGNFIGTDVTGTRALGNLGNGVEINGSSSNTIGGAIAGARNIISGNNHLGVIIFIGAAGNRVQGNFIGTDVAGTHALGNGDTGVGIFNVAGNTIGGMTVGARNVVSGNAGDGIAIINNGAIGNQVQGNFIGTDANGTAALSNKSHGVVIANTRDNIIGGTTMGARNLISGNLGFGVIIGGSEARGNQVQGNYIGTDTAGAAKLGNFDGVLINDNASSNTVGGTTVEARNIISGNNVHGVEIARGATGNQIQGNFIGTDVTGTADLGNSLHGVLVVLGASSNAIGGMMAGARNVISGNAGYGVAIEGAGSRGNQVQGNFIGTNVTGTGALGNDQGVFILNAPGNMVGGTTAGARNIISGNFTNGVNISGSNASGNLVQGNYIGTDVNGTAALGNSFYGVVIDKAPNNTIGGTTAGARNIISGNIGYGVSIFGGEARGNQVQGNFIGTDATGTNALSNTQDGVFILEAPNNTIGGTIAGARNIISGNFGNGVNILGSGATGNQVQGNYIGTDATGAARLGNFFDGVIISDAPGNTIGGTMAGARNVISGNNLSGISIVGGGSTGNRVQGNYIGISASGMAAMGNSFDGVFISGPGNTIGGAITGAGNTIAFNGGDGVSVGVAVPPRPDPTGNVIQSNSIFSNAGLGINLGVDGPTLNDPGDDDASVNNLQNFPTLMAVSSTGSNTTIRGMLNSAANTTFTIQFFANAACDPSGFGEGQTFLGSTMVTTNAGGNATIMVTLSASVSLGQHVTATATDPNNNTSEFCRCVEMR